MEKTNIRIRNYFIIEDEKEYYSSSVNDLGKWKGLDEEELKDVKDDNVTETLEKLMKKYDIYSNVNFFDIKDNKKTVKVTQKGG